MGSLTASSSFSRIGKADLHIHTCHDGWCDGNDTVEVIFEYVEMQTDLTLIAFTDHDNASAGRAGRELHARGRYRFDFLPGTEITTTSGHVICYFPNEIVDVPSLRSLRWTSSYVREHGGFVVLAHPVYPPWLRRNVAKPDSPILQLVAAVEVINGGLSQAAQARLYEIAVQLDGRTALVGNSDSHHKESIGSVVTQYPGHSLDDFLAALRSRQTRPVAGTPIGMPKTSRAFTRRRSMTRPGWVRNIYREARGQLAR